MRAKTRALGQHFLADRHVLDRIIAASVLGKGETACEAGTGNGVLTEELCKHTGRVISYEVDRGLYEDAQSMGFENLQLVNADLFKVKDIEFDVFVSNLPYSRSRDAMQWLATMQFQRAIVMVQREFADKISARPGDENYRAISATCSYCFKIERLFAVGKDAFNPPPKVESEVLRLVPVHTITPDAVKKVNELFSQRNKKATRVAARMGVQADFGDRRIDQLAPEEIMRIVA
ncbi:MAG: ribosomal RNA small subunit methyltransferase A [Nitrososphaera sp.]|uniref:ribosomal RNA small subunit methyltransferase A n=1 Tax=Nitrososphaera sp. TaxID=1971748 RepID=UPI003D6FEA09